MSYKIVDAVFEEYELESSVKLVLLVVARHANDGTRVAWPSVDTISKQTGLHKRTVQRGLQTLERIGIIRDVTEYDDGEKIHVRSKGGTGHPTRYRVIEEEMWSPLIIADFKETYRVRHGDIPTHDMVTEVGVPR